MTEITLDETKRPVLEPASEHVTVEFNNVLIADSRRAIRVIESGHPAVWYIPPEDVRVEFLVREPYTSWCPWKGSAHYYQLTVNGKTSDSAAWCYSEPLPDFASIRHYIAFYPARVSKATVDGHTVAPEAEEYYGGWVIPGSE
jgi:uncharacterized protein (DUF427 family)